jgi:hypothetical protein
VEQGHPRREHQAGLTIGVGSHGDRDYRLVYGIVDKDRVIEVLKVGGRKEVYRR